MRVDDRVQKTDKKGERFMATSRLNKGNPSTALAEGTVITTLATQIAGIPNHSKKPKPQRPQKTGQKLQHTKKSPQKPLFGISSAKNKLQAEIDDSVTLYLKEIGRVPLLTAEQEVDCAKRIERGRIAQKTMELKTGVPESIDELNSVMLDGQKALDCLVRANSRLVVSVAKKYVGRGVPFLDLIQEGNIGLMRAVRKFDYRRGYKFSTYATWWIRQAVTRAIADQGRTIRVPVHMYEQINKVARATHDLSQQLGHDPTPEDIGEKLGINPTKVKHVLHVAERPLSLEMSLTEEDNTSLTDFVEDEGISTPNTAATSSALRKTVDEILETLTPREVRILQLRFGLVDGYSYTLEEVGEKFGVTRERIRQIESHALGRLRHPSRSRKLRDYVEI